jgi:glycosyltransferase involved in cell wall biosynthesis
MRIALVVPGGVGSDGVHAVIPALLSLIERLARDHDVLVLATEQVASPAEYRRAGARIVFLGRHRRGALGRIRILAIALVRLRRFRPDVIHAFWLGPTSSIALVAGRLLGVPVVVSLGGGELAALPRIGYGGALSRRGRLHVRLAVEAARAMTAGSRFALAPLLPRRPDARWLPLGADPVPPSDRPADGTSTNLVRLLVVANVNRVKGPDVVIGALLRLRRDLGLDARLDWIGEDTLAGSTAALAGSLGVADAIAVRGFAPHAEVLAWMEQADVLVQGSHHESQGVAVLEAAMRGLPTVGTSVGLLAELAALDPPAAVVVPPGDATALADAIAAVVGDPGRRERLGTAARAWARAHDADWTASAFEALYAEVVGEPRRRSAARPAR